MKPDDSRHCYIQQQFAKLGTHNDILLVLQCQEYVQELFNEIDLARLAAKSWQDTAIGCEQRLNRRVAELHKQVEALERLGNENRHKLRDVESIAKEMI